MVVSGGDDGGVVAVLVRVALVMSCSIPGECRCEEKFLWQFSHTIPYFRTTVVVL